MARTAGQLVNHTVSRFNDSASNAPLVDEWLVRRLAAGWSAQALAAASDGRMSVRTAYRWRRDFDRLETVTVGSHRATFLVRRRGLPPVRISAWEPAP